MPLSETDLLDAKRVARVYANAESRIMMRIATALSTGVDAPDWEVRTLGRIQRLRAEAVAEFAAADALVAGLINDKVSRLYEGASTSLLRDVGRDLAPQSVASTTMRSAVKHIARELEATNGEAVTSLLRRTFDEYRTTVGNVVQSVVARGESKRDALKRATESFFKQGLPSFKDKSGRNWNIQSYVDMAVRTGYAGAQIQGQEDALGAAGLDFVIVQPGPRACEICDKWARKVLSRSGVTGTVNARNALSGNGTVVKVDGTLAEARAAGFQHPNCRCSIAAFIPGLTKRADIVRPPWDAEGYERQQQQRGIERRIRSAKSDLATATASGDAKSIAVAKRRVAKTQSQLRDHLAANPALKRRSDREQIFTNDSGVAERQPTVQPVPTPKPDVVPDVVPPRVDVDKPTKPKSTKINPDEYTMVAPDGSVLRRNSKREFTHANLYFKDDRWNISQMTSNEQSARNYHDRLVAQGFRAVIVTPVRTVPRVADVVVDVVDDVVDVSTEAMLMSRFKRLDKPESMSEIVTKSNPGGDSRLDRDYLMNCHYVVGAVEMRARGYDVVARPTIKTMGRFDDQIESDWAGEREFSYRRNAEKDSRGMYVQKSSLAWIDAETASMPVGARGYVTGAWARGGGGHIWSWEKTSAGVVYHEGQIKHESSDRARDNVLRLDGNSVAIMRVDDLQPSNGLIATVQSPDEFALDGAAHARNEISRLEEIISALDSEIIAEQKVYDAAGESHKRYVALKDEEKRRKKLSMSDRFAAMKDKPLTFEAWGIDRTQAQIGLNAFTVLQGTITRRTKLRTEINRLKRELKSLGG